MLTSSLVLNFSVRPREGYVTYDKSGQRADFGNGNKQDRQCMYNVKLRRVRATIVAVGK